uniref:DUF4258 domain-containing protein n=1 Tax=Candidatus Kentrum sp. FW TaxID=2126338 RepID=A0A450U3T3_9GAMM|nr:MAG: protein of unknown function (DUF4258) [Candidatus Kentron sp. FW]
MQNSIHFDAMLQERGIKREWIEQTVRIPDRTEYYDDGTRHLIKRIPEFGNRWLRVIVNTTVRPEKRITAFFDRRLRRKK